MPSKSKAQAKLMRAAAHDPDIARKVGIKMSKAKEWVAADKKKGTKALPVRKGKKG